MADYEITTIAESEALPELFGKRDENDKPLISEVVCKIEETARSIVIDIDTKEGQSTCRSLAAKIASAKNTIDSAGKTKKEEYTVFTKQIDSDRRFARETLKDLQEEIRKPLTDMENAEKERRKKHEEAIEFLENTEFDQGLEVTSEMINDRLNSIKSVQVNESFDEYEATARDAQKESIEVLETMLNKVKQREAEKAELEALRAKQAEMERIQREQQLVKEAEEREARKAKEREQRLIAEREEAERRAQRAAEIERQRIEREAQARRQKEIELQANKAHRDAVLIRAKDDLIKGGVSEECAKQAIRLIYKDEVRHVSINF